MLLEEQLKMRSGSFPKEFAKQGTFIVLVEKRGDLIAELLACCPRIALGV